MARDAVARRKNDKGPGIAAGAGVLAVQVKLVAGTRNYLNLLLNG